MGLLEQGSQIEELRPSCRLRVCRVPGPVRGGPLGAAPLAEPLLLPRRPQLSGAAARPLRQLPVQGHRHQLRGPEPAQRRLPQVQDQRRR